MQASEEITYVKDIVKELLEKFEKYRNSDKKLCCRVWQIQLEQSGRDVKKLSTFDFFVLYCDANLDMLYSHESIARAARMIKEKHPELQGNKEKRLEECDNVKMVVHNPTL